VVLRALDLSAKNRHLMPEGQQLEVALRLGSRAEHEDLDQQSQQAIDGCEEHGRAR